MTSATIHKPTVWWCQCILASTLPFTYPAAYCIVLFFAASLYTWQFVFWSCSYGDLFLSFGKWV